MLALIRLLHTTTETRGILLSNGDPVCHTLELPWRQNARQVSCIPTGVYPISSVVSERHGPCFLIDKVPDRSGILIHSGNTVADTQGCILLGLDVSSSGVLHSRLALSRLSRIISKSTLINVRDL